MSILISPDLLLSEEERAHLWAKLWNQHSSFHAIPDRDLQAISLYTPKSFYEAFLRGFFQKDSLFIYQEPLNGTRNKDLAFLRESALLCLSKENYISFTPTDHCRKFKEKYLLFKEFPKSEALEEVLLILFLVDRKAFVYEPLEELLDLAASLFFVNHQFIPSLFFTEPHIDFSLQGSIFDLLEKIWEVPDLKFPIKENHEPKLQELFYRLMGESLKGFFTAHEKRKIISSESYHCLHASEKFWGCFSLQGKSSSMGYLRKGDIHIVAMAPHYPPLYSEKGFGLFHLSQNTTLSSGTHYEGWARTTNFDGERPSLGSDWVRCDIKCNEGYRVSVTRQMVGDEPLYFSFFVTGDQLTVDGKEIKPLSLDRYCGLAQRIILKKGGDTLHFEGVSQKVEILPLAGEEFFWGANFMIAFELDCNNKKFNSHIF